MSCQVRWVVFLRVKSAKKATPLLDHFAEAIGKEITVREGGRYWKDQSLFRVVATCQLPIGDLSSALLATLQMCWRLAPSWTLVAPQVYENECWEFSGSALSQTIGIEGLTDIDFQVCNWEESPTESSLQSKVANGADTAAQ